MKLLGTVFGNINMTWKKTLLFAVVTGIYTGIVNQIPGLKGTSVQDIAVTMEWWLLFAVIIATNTKSAKESALKIFVFFMVSQPVVFLIELPMLGLETALGYYRMWIGRIFLTLPGGFLAYYAKKESVMGSLILSCATVLLAVLGYSYAVDCIADFPHHILTVLFCFVQCIIYVLLLKKKWLYRSIVIGLTAIALIVCLLFFKGNTVNQSVDLPDGNWVCVTEFDDGSTGSINGSEFIYTYDSSKFADKVIEFENEEGDILQYRAYKDENGSVWIAPIE